MAQRDAGLSKNATHTTRQLRLPLPGTECKRCSCLQHGMLRQLDKTGCIGFRSLGEPEHAFIAGELTLDAETPFNPMQDWIQWKYNQAYLLQQVNPIVSTA